MENSKIRIGKDFNVFWTIYKIVDGKRQPYNLVGKELQLYYRTSYGRVEAKDWKVNDNVINWTFFGKEQKYIGNYELILVENAGQEGMVTVDTCNAFSLVAHSCEEYMNEAENIVVEAVTTESDVALAPVVKEVGGGESYDDTELREAIADLQEENERLKERIEEQDQFIEDLQNTKIEKENDDYYPKMAVGLADNLAGVDVVDSEINFRRSGGGAISDGVARIESIKGNSVVWNQFAKEINATNWGVYNSTFASQTFSNGEINVAVQDITLTGYRVGITLKALQSIVIGHIYLAVGEIKCAVPCRFTIEVKKSSVAFGEVTTTWTPLSAFVTSDQASTRCIISPQGTFTESANTYSVRGVRLFDLTQMFGAGNEPTTIEEFYARIPMGVDMNAYNEGEVIHMDVQSVESQGVNAWDEEWELGAISTANGADRNDITTQIRSKFIPIKGGAAYYAASAGVTWGFFYDKDKKPISQNVTSTTAGIASEISGITFITPTNARYMRFYLLASYGTTYNHDICINLFDASINGKYFPYIKRVEDLSIIRKYFPDGMKSAGSAHDEIRYNKTNGKWEKVVRIGEVDMGSLTFSEWQDGMYAANLADMAIKGQILCAKYSTDTYTNVTAKNMGIASLTDKGGIVLYDSAYTTPSAVKAALQGVILYYELAEPIVTELDEADQFKDLDYQVWNCGTEKAIAEGKSAPLAADITYGFNAIGKIKELENLVAALRAKVGI